MSEFARNRLRRIWDLECIPGVPSDQANWLKKELWNVKWWAKFFKRRFYMALCGQSKLELREIPPNARRILWINQTAPSLGDALMDTSGRALLSDRQIHLLTSEKNAQLFEADRFFERVFADTAQAKSEHGVTPYDLVIVDSFSPRTISKKMAVAPRTPLVGLYGYLNGFEVHRTLFSYHRIGKLLGLDGSDIVGKRVVHHSLGLTQRDNPEMPQTIAIGIGGEWKFRTYKHWDDVIALALEEFPESRIVLVGSENGIEASTLIESSYRDSGRIQNSVGRLTILDTCALLRSATIYVGADGGLWHMASGCGLPSVALFADCALYNDLGNSTTRASPDQICIPLMAKTEVSEIEPGKVIQGIRNALASTQHQESRRRS